MHELRSRWSQPAADVLGVILLVLGGVLLVLGGVLLVLGGVLLDLGIDFEVIQIVKIT